MKKHKGSDPSGGVFCARMYVRIVCTFYQNLYFHFHPVDTVPQFTHQCIYRQQLSADSFLSRIPEPPESWKIPLGYAVYLYILSGAHNRPRMCICIAYIRPFADWILPAPSGKSGGLPCRPSASSQGQAFGSCSKRALQTRCPWSYSEVIVGGVADFILAAQFAGFLVVLQLVAGGPGDIPFSPGVGL